MTNSTHALQHNQSVALIENMEEENIRNCRKNFYANFEAESTLELKSLETFEWYHGRTTRIEAESRVLYSGQFLVRDCISKPGHYVLTCNWDGRPVHFMINKVDPCGTVAIKMAPLSPLENCQNNEIHKDNNNNYEVPNKSDAMLKLASNQQSVSLADINNNNDMSVKDDVSHSPDREEGASDEASGKLPNMNTYFRLEGELYPSVPSLIDDYMSDEKPITKDSMCLINSPVARPTTLKSSSLRDRPTGGYSPHDDVLTICNDKPKSAIKCVEETGIFQGQCTEATSLKTCPSSLKTEGTSSKNDGLKSIKNDSPESLKIDGKSLNTDAVSLTSLKTDTTSLGAEATLNIADSDHNTNTVCNTSNSLLTGPAINNNDVAVSGQFLTTPHHNAFRVVSENWVKNGPLNECLEFNGKIDVSGACANSSLLDEPPISGQQTELVDEGFLLDQPVCYMPCGGKFEFSGSDVRFDRAEGSHPNWGNDKSSTNPPSMQTRPLPPVPTAQHRSTSKGDRDSGIGTPPVKPQLYGVPSWQPRHGTQGQVHKNKCKTSGCNSESDFYRKDSRLKTEKDEDNDYHEYCDIDYDEPRRGSSVAGTDHGVVFRAAHSHYDKNMRFNTDRSINGVKTCMGANGSKMGQSKLTVPNVAPPLPPRHQEFSVERDSACMPDMGIYDKVNSQDRLLFQRLHSQPLESRINLQNFSLPATLKALCCDEPLKPLDGRFWPDLMDAFLGLSSSRLAGLMCESDSDFLDTRKSGKTSRIFQQCWAENKRNFFFDLFLIPAGRRFRLDVLERHNCWRRFVQASLLKVEGSRPRATLLAKWIDVAGQLYENFANFFAFGYVMAALESEQVLSLGKTWRKLRVDFTELALTYETQLRPRFAALQKNPCSRATSAASHTGDCGRPPSVPDLEPVARLLEADSIHGTWLFEWEEADDFFGIDVLWDRLSEARRWIIETKDSSLNLHTQSEEISSKRAHDIFVTEFDSVIGRTEFHLTFLWGATGAGAPSLERYRKFDLLMTLMADKAGADSS